MDNITPEKFLQTVFPADMLLADEVPLIAKPESFINDQGLEVNYYKQKPGIGAAVRSCRAGSGAWYYCVSTVKPRHDGKIKRTYDDLIAAYVLVLDDIGTKAVAPPVRPSYVIETSKDNYQYGYLLDPFNVTSGLDAGYYDNCLASCARAGYNDPGCRTAMRMVRLPGSLHRTGFVARVAQWGPDRVWDLRELMVELGVEVKPGRKVKGAPKPGKYTRLADVDDRDYQWLVDNWTIYGHNDQWVYIECPWRAAHTDGRQGVGSTGYSPQGYGREGTQFNCFHSHCKHLNAGDFLSWVSRKQILSTNP